MTWLRNRWYVAGLDSEVSRAPLGRMLLDERIVFYRKDDGGIVALQDRCPHRFVPLSMGKLCGDEIMCLYHGLRFDADGACTHNPHSKGAVPSALRVASFPVVERYGFVWFWPGDPERADPALIEPIGFIADAARFAHVRGYLSVAAHYELITDNLLDLSHVETLHPLFATDQGVEGHRIECWQDDDRVYSNRWKPNSSINGFARLLWSSSANLGDARANMRWQAPARLDFDLGVTECGAAEDDGVCTPAVHLLTPETSTRTHYFWAQGRNRQLDDDALAARIEQAANHVFLTEDKPIIEAQQAALGDSTDLMAMKPILLASDTPPVRARRLLKRLIAAERAAEEKAMVARNGEPVRAEVEE